MKVRIHESRTCLHVIWTLANLLNPARDQVLLLFKQQGLATVCHATGMHVMPCMRACRLSLKHCKKTLQIKWPYLGVLCCPGNHRECLKMEQKIILLFCNREKK